MLAPIILFAYNRPEHTEKTINALRHNDLASESDLFVFCDGPKITVSEEQKSSINSVRQIVHNISGFKTIHIEESSQNKGLANSVITGVTQIINKYGKVIVVEDDIITHPFFLRYMNDCLSIYQDRKDVFMIGGFNYNISIPKDYKEDVYIVHRSCTWGWATWKNRWDKADWCVTGYQTMCNDKKEQKRFNRGGLDMFPMLQAQMEGKIDSWGIRWDYCMYKHNGGCIHPVKSLCHNCGFDGSGVHCSNVSSNYTAPLYDAKEYAMRIKKDITYDDRLSKRFSLFQTYGGNISSFTIIKNKIRRIYLRLRNKVAQSSTITPTIFRLFRYKKTPFGAILMLHRVDKPDNNGIWYNQHLKLSPRVIEEMVSYARKRKCIFVSLDEMADALTRKKRHRRMIVITLDDGYRDNYTNGLPLFTKLNVPFTIYVCTKMVNGKMLYWWEILEQLVLNHDKITLNDGRTFACSTKEEKEKAFFNIREIIIKLPQNNLEEKLKQLFERYEIDYQYGNQNLGLTWAQIKELKNSPLSTIGNHTYSHCAFTGCSDEDIISDINLANKEMANKMNLDMHHFAFPFGEAAAVSQHDIELVKRLKLTTSATTREDFIRFNTDPMNLPRFFITDKNWKQVIDIIADYC